jgi:MYXO-CTERM domain-containing protein
MTSGRCVGCLGDTDCPAPMLCDGATHTCLECTTIETQNCGTDLAGRQCLPGGKCGCAQDSDCGGATSGRVCDPVSSRCVPGCRGSGGNACPAGQPCSSSTTEIGRCNGQPPADGGATDAAAGDGNAGDAGGDASPRDAAGADSADASSGAGGRSPDAGADASTGVGGHGGGADAGTPADGGPDVGAIGAANPGGYIAGGGCACAAAGTSGSPSFFALAILAAIGWARRRPRRR